MFPKEQYREAVNHAIVNTNTKRPLIELTKREILWLSIAPALYVIGPEEKSKYFDIQAEEQGFHRILTKIQPEVSLADYLDANPESKELSDWIEDFRSTYGCHVSHAAVARDMLKNDYSCAIVFENDCAFYNILSNELLKELGEVYTQEKDTFDFLGLGCPPRIEKTNITRKTKGSKISLYTDPYGYLCYEGDNFKIMKGQPSLTHFYVMNKKTAKKLADSLDIDIPCPTPIETPISAMKHFSSEYFYRGGADDFFSGFVDQFYVTPILAYQQYIGGNVEREKIPR
jgi:hypothetical protein